MTREIEFRAWNKLSNEMITKNGIEFKDGSFLTPCLMFDGDFICFDLEDHQDNALIEKKDLEIMQFTGLLDKNGKKIFEGDIVNAQYNICDLFKNVAIYFENGCFYADDKCPVGNLPLNYFFENNKGIEVIGNIYENPELLEEHD